MSAPQTYSMETTALTPSPDAGVQALSITGSASLMQNFEPSRAVDCEDKTEIKALQDANGKPVVFSVGTGGQLFAILPNDGIATGWRDVCLTDAIADGRTVEAFEAVALPGNKFAVAVSLTDGTASTVYIAATQTLDAATTAWADYGSSWGARPAPMAVAKVAEFLMGPSDDSDIPAVVAVLSSGGSRLHRYAISADPAVTDAATIWTEWDIAGVVTSKDADGPIIHMAIGVHPRINLAGTYSLYTSGQRMMVTFTAFTESDGQYPSTEMSDLPADAKYIAAVQTDYSASNGHNATELYVAADGVYRYTVSAQIHRTPPTAISDALVADKGTKLEVLCDGETIAIWTLYQGVLSYMHGAVGMDPEWSTLLPLKGEVGKMTVLRNTRWKTDQVFDVDASSQLGYFYRDPRSTLWREMRIPLADVGNAVPYDGYTTCLHFTGDDGLPWSGPLTMTASAWIQLTVNGKSHMIGDGQSIAVAPDPQGTLTVVTKMTTASTPILSITGDGFAETVDIAPQQILTANLKNFTTTDAVTGATTQTGEPIIGDDADITAEQFAMALSKITAASDAATPTTIRVRQPGDRPSNVVDAAALNAAAGGQSMAVMKTTGAAPRLLLGDEARRALPMASAKRTRGGLQLNVVDSVTDFFGDVWSAIKSGLAKVGSWALHVAEEGLSLIVELADGLVHLVLDTLEKIFEVLSWIADQIAMVLGKLIRWIGQLFGWDDILTTHRAMVNGVVAALDWTVDSIGEMQSAVDGVLDDVTELLTGHGLPEDVAGKTLTDVSSTASSTAGPADDYTKSPAGGFASYHMAYSGPTDSDASPGEALSDVLDDFIQTVADAVGGIYDTVKQVILDIVNGIADKTMTIGDIFQKVVDDLLTGVMSTITLVVDDFFQIAADLARLLKAMLTASIEIPFLSGFYRAVTGDKDITMLNVFTLILAVPAATALKIVGKSDIFDTVAPLAVAGMSSKDFLDTVTYVEPKSLSAAANTSSGSSDQQLTVAYTILGANVMMVSTAISVVLSGLRAAGVPANKFFSWAQTILLAVNAGSTLPVYVDKNIGWRTTGWILRVVSVLAAYITASEPGAKRLSGAMSITVGVAGLIVAFATTIQTTLLDDDSTTEDIIVAVEAGIAGVAGNIGAIAGGVASYDPELVSKETLAAASVICAVVALLLNGGRLIYDELSDPMKVY